LRAERLGISRTPKDITSISNIKRKDIARTYRLLILELNYKIPMIDPVECIVRVANKANLSEKTKPQAMDIMHSVTTSGISAGKDPMGLAASVIYLSCLNRGESRTQSDIADTAGVTEVT
jgi:transcription initiation factor TFIIB